MNKPVILLNLWLSESTKMIGIGKVGAHKAAKIMAMPGASGLIAQRGPKNFLDPFPAAWFV